MLLCVSFIYGVCLVSEMRKFKDWSDFDMILFLSEYDISYTETGKNIGAGWIGIETCPFCECTGNHFGLKLETNTGSCWVCGETGNAPKIVQALLNESWGEVYRIMNGFMDSDRVIPESPEHGDAVLFPDNIQNMCKAACDYLRGRRFNPEEMIKKYKIKSTAGNSYLKMEDKKWNFNYRVMIPIVMERTIVAYTGRSYVGADPKYMNSPTESCIIPPASCIYNIDSVKDKVILVEGITDVWRFGNETAAMMGVKFTKEQVEYLGSMRISEAYVMFDEGATDNARELAMALTSVIDKVKVITLNCPGDPGDMEYSDAMKIKYNLLGRV